MAILAAAVVLGTMAALQEAPSPAGEGPAGVAVLNPVSHPLVGGAWTVELDIQEGGDLSVAAGAGTAFGEDVEFAGMSGGASALPWPAANVDSPDSGRPDGGPPAEEPGRADAGNHPADAPYRDIMVVVAGYDGNGRDVSAEGKAAVAEALARAGARSITAAESLPFVTASVPAEFVPEISGHDLMYRVEGGGARAYPLIDTMRLTVGAAPDDLRRPGGTAADGSGVTVGIADDGVNHPWRLNDKVVGRVSCDDLGCSRASAGDVAAGSHGTEMALIVAGSGFPEHNGMAPGVDILDAGFSMNWLGAGDAAISHAFSWLLRNDADVSNLSFGYGKCRGISPDATRLLITGEAVDRGMVVVVSSGNEGSLGEGNGRTPVFRSINQWGCAHNTITAGGIDDRDPDNIRLYGNSGRGPATHSVNGDTYPVLKPEIVAPAVLEMPQYAANGTDALTVTTKGTSYSAPAVSAAAALVLSEREMQPAAVKAAILLGANWTGPVPCTSVQYERDAAADDCSHGRQPGSFAEASGAGALGIVNNVGFGILDVARTLDYVAGASGAT